MKKTRGKKKVNSKKKKKSSFKSTLAVIGVVAAFLLCMILLGFMDNGQSQAKITGDVIKITGEEGTGSIDLSGIGTFFSNFIDPVKADATVLKWIVFFVFVVAFWGILYFFRGKDKSKPLNPFFMILAFPVAFAMVYLLNVTEILAAIVPYSALGLAIIVGAPFVGIILGSLYLLQGRRNATKVVVQLLAWYFYLTCLIYFLYRTLSDTTSYSLWVLLIIIGGMIISIILIVKNKQWREWIAKLEREGIEKGIEDVQHALGAKERAEQERGRRTIEEAGGIYYNPRRR